MDHPGVAAGAELLLEPHQIHRELPHPLLQGLNSQRQGEADGNAVIVREREGEVALVLQPSVQFQVPGLHVGVGIRPRRVLHPSLAAVVDAQHIFRGVKCGVIALHVEVVIHEIDAGEQVILGHNSFPSLTMKLEDTAPSALRQRAGKTVICHDALQHGFPSFQSRSTRSQERCINSRSWVTTNTIRPCRARFRITPDTSTMRA